jgi:inhibitor of KinA sporulation pathway (predicted exonuclease)
MLELEELVVNQVNKIIRERNLQVDQYDVERIKMAIEENFSLLGRGNCIQDPRYLVIDLEATTDDDSKGFGHEMIEIGAVLVAGDGMRFVNGEFSSFCKPAKNPVLTDFCKQLTHISQEDVDNAPGFVEVMRNLERWLSAAHQLDLNELILCSWGEDNKLLRSHCNELGIPYKFGPARNIALDYKAKFKKKHASLSSAIEFFKLQFKGIPHRALSDADNTAVIFSNYILNNRDF